MRLCRTPPACPEHTWAPPEDVLTSLWMSQTPLLNQPLCFLQGNLLKHSCSPERRVLLQSKGLHKGEAGTAWTALPGAFSLTHTLFLLSAPISYSFLTSAHPVLLPMVSCPEGAHILHVIALGQEQKTEEGLASRKSVKKRTRKNKALNPTTYRRRSEWELFNIQTFLTEWKDKFIKSRQWTTCSACSPQKCGWHSIGKAFPALRKGLLGQVRQDHWVAQEAELPLY